MQFTNVKLVTFDVYMALLNIQGGLTRTFADATGLEDERAGAMVALWRAKQMERAASSNSMAVERVPFRHCTALALDYVCRRHDLNLDRDTRERLVMAWDTLSPWPEAEQALRELKLKGYAIAILSNGDQDMLDNVAGQFQTVFDHVLSSQSAGKYKPHPAVYALPETQLGIGRGETLHVAGSGNDVLGAVAFGMRCVWSNKTGDCLLDPAAPPTREIANLSELPALL